MGRQGEDPGRHGDSFSVLRHMDYGSNLSFFLYVANKLLAYEFLSFYAEGLRKHLRSIFFKVNLFSSKYGPALVFQVISCFSLIVTVGFPETGYVLINPPKFP